MSGSSPLLVSPSSVGRLLAPTRMPTGSSSYGVGRSRSTSRVFEELLDRNLRNGRISFSTELAPAVGEADLVFLAVGTPMRRGDGHADLSFVFRAVEELAPH